MIKGTNLTNRCIWLDMFSLLPVAPTFPFQSWSYHERTYNIILRHWTHFIMLLKYYVHCYYIAEATNYEDKSLYFYLQNYTIEYILIYYHCTVVLILFCCLNVISLLTLYGWSHKSYKEQSDVVQLGSETYNISQNLSIFKITLLSTC